MVSPLCAYDAETLWLRRISVEGEEEERKMGWTSSQEGEAFLGETRERSSGSRSETERSVGVSPKNAAAGSGPGVASTKPNPEVSAGPERRRFTASYKLEVLRRADACKEPGEVGALLRREGLYSSHLSAWRRQREQGALRELGGRKRGRRSQPPNPLAARVAELEREKRKLERRLHRAETIIEIQKKTSALLGIPLKSLDNESDD